MHIVKRNGLCVAREERKYLHVFRAGTTRDRKNTSFEWRMKGSRREYDISLRNL